MRYRGWVTDRVTDVSELVPGSHVIALCRPTEVDAFGFRLRRHGFEVRDCLFIPLSRDKSLHAILARTGLHRHTIAGNVTQYGTGMLDIDACRVSVDPEEVIEPSGEETVSTAHGGYTRPNRSMYTHHPKERNGPANPDGRFPSNCIWFHRPECKCVGMKQVQGAGWRDSDSKGAGMGYHGADGDGGSHYVDENGKETVSDWRCVPDCAVLALDEQGGVLKGGYMKAGQQRKKSRGLGGYNDNFPDEATQGGSYGDKGGASRFFNQVQSFDELLDLLVRMVYPDEHAVRVDVQNTLLGD